MRVAAVVLLMASACTPAPLPLPRFDDVAHVAVLTLDREDRLTAASEVRPLDGPLDLFTADATTPLIVVGWPAGAFGATTPDPTAALTARAACAPRLPAPTRAATLDGDTLALFDLARVPPLSAPWAAELCPTVDPSAFAYRADCATARVDTAATPTGACTFDLTLDVLGLPLAARVDPDGSLCVAPAREGDPACAAVPARAPADGTFVCSASATCPVDVFVAPAAPRLTVQRAQLLDVPPFLPDASLTGTQPQLPPFGQYVGYTHDVVVLGDTVVASTSTGAALILCSGGEVPGLLHARRTADLSPIATATAPSCLTLLAPDGDSALGLHVEGEGFALVRVAHDLRVTRLRALDDRDPLADPDVLPPVARSACERPIDLLLDDARLLVVMERLPHCAPRPGTSVHVFDRRTLALRERHFLPLTTPWRALLDGDRLIVAHATERAVVVHSATSFAVRARLEIMPDLSRNDFTIADVALESDDVLAATTRNQPALRRSDGAGAFTARGYFLAAEADPVGLFPGFTPAHGLVIGVQDGDRQRWPAQAALYDRATLTVLLGGVPIGHGPPRRLRADGQGGVIALLPWEAALVRLRP